MESVPAIRNKKTSIKVHRPKSHSNVESAIDTILLSRYMPACAVINKDLEILQFRGPISLYLTHPSGKASLNILKMARPEFAFQLRSAINKALKTKQLVQTSEIELHFYSDQDESVSRRISLEVSPLKIERDEPLLLIVFRLQEQVEKNISTAKGEKTNLSQKDQRIKTLTTELNSIREEINHIIKLQETTYEKLQAMKEEAMLSNEEFQALNEELETSKEEIEASNEELISANNELSIANEELIYQNKQKEKRAAELIIANKELTFQNKEKEKREIANVKLQIKVQEHTLELSSSLEREKEMNIMKSNFVTMASHEFRTPLTTILSSSTLIAQYKDAEQQENRLKHINRINSSVNDLTEILNDFLSLAEVENSIIVVKNIVFNLPEFINELVEEMNGMISKKKLIIIYHHSGEVMIKQSKKTLKKILSNLISNAIKYSLAEKKIEIISSVINNRILITIKDYGVGIPEEEQKHLFTEFFRARNVENIQGTGLGLIIVKKYVKLLNGNISFISELNKGTSFTVEFPNIVK